MPPTNPPTPQSIDQEIDELKRRLRAAAKTVLDGQTQLVRQLRADGHISDHAAASLLAYADQLIAEVAECRKHTGNTNRFCP